mmetsp:Transcript_18562/g.62210  ORF Transcript_18562/g.62210 Transcript_18562/m.62210 type:complete len:250 (+) Transcript_18562:1101-1850(+)
MPAVHGPQPHRPAGVPGVRRALHHKVQAEKAAAAGGEQAGGTARRAPPGPGAPLPAPVHRARLPAASGGPGGAGRQLCRVPRRDPQVAQGRWLAAGAGAIGQPVAESGCRPARGPAAGAGGGHALQRRDGPPGHPFRQRGAERERRADVRRTAADARRRGARQGGRGRGAAAAPLAAAGGQHAAHCRGSVPGRGDSTPRARRRHRGAIVTTASRSVAPVFYSLSDTWHTSHWKAWTYISIHVASTYFWN